MLTKKIIIHHSATPLETNNLLPFIYDEGFRLSLTFEETIQYKVLELGSI